MNIYVAVLTLKGNNSQTENFVKADKDQILYFKQNPPHTTFIK